MVARSRGRSSAAWQKVQPLVPGDTCWFCRRRIPSHEECAIGRWTPRPWLHPFARTVHHVVPIAVCEAEHPQPCPHLTDLEFLRVAHKVCNEKGRAVDPSEVGAAARLALVTSQPAKAGPIDGGTSRTW